MDHIKFITNYLKTRRFIKKRILDPVIDLLEIISFLIFSHYLALIGIFIALYLNYLSFINHDLTFFIWGAMILFWSLLADFYRYNNHIMGGYI